MAIRLRLRIHDLADARSARATSLRYAPNDVALWSLIEIQPGISQVRRDIMDIMCHSLTLVQSNNNESGIPRVLNQKEYCLGFC